MNIGAHVRGGGKLVPSLEAGVEIGATSIQIFTQSPRMWKPSQYAPEVLANYRAAQASHPSVTHTFCHATYLINLASPDRALYERSVECLISNLSTGRGMGSSGVVLHVGSHMGAGFETVIKQISEAFERALDTAEPAPPGVADCPILIENAAGTGGTVGRSFDEIQVLIDATGRDERLGLCIDTQHLWASGVDYSTVAGTNALINEIDERIGIGRLRCFHLNDSKIELGGNRDRHANIDEGTIGTNGLAPLVGHPLIRDLPLLLEVPGAGDGPRAEDVIAARKVVGAGVKLYDGSSPKSLPLKKSTTPKENAQMENTDNVDTAENVEKNENAGLLEQAVAVFESIKEELPKQIAAAEKTAAKIVTVKKSAAKKAVVVKKSAAKKAAVVKKSAAKKAAVVKKSATKKAAAIKKTAANKTVAAKKTATKKTGVVKKFARKSAAAKKSAASRTVAAKKSASKKAAAVKKSTAKKTVAVRRSTTKKAAAMKKIAAKKRAAVKKRPVTKKRAAVKKRPVAKKTVKKSTKKR